MFEEPKRQKLEENQNANLEYEIIINDVHKSLFKCKFCEVICGTEVQFNQHKDGSKHKKNKEGIFKKNGLPIVGIQKSCSICNVTCDSDKQLNIHYQGKSHMKKAQHHKIINFVDESIPDNLLKPKISSNAFECQLCNQSMHTEIQYRFHCTSAKHLHKLKNLTISNQQHNNDNIVTMINDINTNFCEICQIKLHSNNTDSHYNGKKHKDKILKTTHSSDVLDRYPKKNNLSESSAYFGDLKFIPRNYQMEIYRKCLNKDCIIFLPTGTGKTFVATLIILKMLEENPHHRVAFLVDKVLLVMQQHKFLADQFENISLKRFIKDDTVSERKLRLVGLANNFSETTEHSLSIRDHDIIVATADLFRGLLANRKLFWEEFCLVIIDEAHHCTKDHPYNKLLREYHLYPECVRVFKTDIHKQVQFGEPKVKEKQLEDWKRRRCKVIGLTASPAGDMDKDVTFLLLLDLLESLGRVSIVNVTENIEELETFTSTSKIETKLTKYSEKELKLRKIMTSVFFTMLAKLGRSSSCTRDLMINRQRHNLSVAEVNHFINELEYGLSRADATHKAKIKPLIKILDIIRSVDTIGYEVAYRRIMQLLENPAEQQWFYDNFGPVEKEIEEIVNDTLAKESTIIQSILDEAKSVPGTSRTVLVLVKQRETAHYFEEILRRKTVDQNLFLLVGHGTGTSKNDKVNTGMSVRKQKKTLNQIRGKSNQIIVATSVADEGIDLPDCDLVILINPPSSVQALIQVRGRARKKASRLLMVCREKRSIDGLRHLQVREKNIMGAINRFMTG